MTRDMTQQQFAEALQRYGMRESGFMGYVNIGVPGHHIEVSKLNAGTKRRNQLAYLLAKREHSMQECGKCGHIRANHSIPIKLLDGKSYRWQCACGDCSAFMESGSQHGQKEK